MLSFSSQLKRLECENLCRKNDNFNGNKLLMSHNISLHSQWITVALVLFEGWGEILNLISNRSNTID